jgi:hypothetical protein
LAAPTIFEPAKKETKDVKEMPPPAVEGVW